jgi:hypothetical protein
MKTKQGAMKLSQIHRRIELCLREINDNYMYIFFTYDQDVSVRTKFLTLNIVFDLLDYLRFYVSLKNISRM